MYCKVGSHKTSVFTEDGYTKVVYHNTVVVKFNHKAIVLNSGGWKTHTTKTRMNQASRQFDLGFHVYQKNGEWFVDYKSEFDTLTANFEDDMTIERVAQ